MAHQLRHAILETCDEREKIVEVDVAWMLELPGEVIRSAHALRTVLVTLRRRVRAGGSTGLARQLAHGPRERGMVVDPVVRVDVRGLTSYQISCPHELRAVLGERLRAIDLSREELGRTPEGSVLADERADA